MRDRRDLLALAVHLLLFPRRAMQSVSDAWKLARQRR